jgi:hypothetical protein
MDESKLIERLGALEAPAEEASRRSAVRMISARVGAGAREKAEAAPRRPLFHRPSLLLAMAVAPLIAAVAVVAVFAGGAGSPAPAYGAELVRFAESTPLLLLEGAGWRVQHVYQSRTSAGIEGSMEFVTGKPIPFESVRVTGTAKAEGESGMFPAAVRQRRVELSWRHENLADALHRQLALPHPQGRHWVKLPVLGTTAHVDTRAERFDDQGGPGDREMIAFWAEGARLLTLEAAVPNLAAFEDRLGWLTKVDSLAWLEGMPEEVVKAAEFDGTVREMVKDIPLPKTFGVSRVPHEGLATDREALGTLVAGTVSCLWLRQWSAARNSGNAAAAAEAVEAMATSPHWGVFSEDEPTNGYPPTVWRIAASMKQGYWDWHGHHRNLLAHAEGLNCAHFGLPLMAEKIKRQRQHGVPPIPG